jgi:NitT/TauT family transport system permease protein
MSMERLSAWLAGAWVPLAVLVVWEAILVLRPSASELMARPSAIAQNFLAALGSDGFWIATMQTLGAAGWGALLAMVLALLLGLMIGLWPRFETLAAPLVGTLRPVPAVALIPLGILVFGFGAAMEILTVAFAVLWPALAIVVGAIRGLEPRLHEVARTLELSLWQRIRWIVWPQLVPRLILMLRLSLGVALVVAVTVEIAANPQGLGYGIVSAQQALQPAQAFAWLVWLGMLGVGINALLSLLERRLKAYA